MIGSVRKPVRDEISTKHKEDSMSAELGGRSDARYGRCCNHGSHVSKGIEASSAGCIQEPEHGCRARNEWR